MKGNRVLSLLGLSKKAGRLVSGGIFHRDSRENGQGLPGAGFPGSLGEYKEKIPEYVRLLPGSAGRVRRARRNWGGSIGQEYRASLAVTDPGLAGAIRKQLENEDERRS